MSPQPVLTAAHGADIVAAVTAAGVAIRHR
jgi:hypothetical protein